MEYSEQTIRARRALQYLALGDALGMPTQSMSPADIETTYGEIRGLVDASTNQPIAPSMVAGHVTDDTEQTLLVAKLLASHRGTIPPLSLADALLHWEDDMRARGSLDLLGPSTRAALHEIRSGADPWAAGRNGTTNGAAMRVAPVGIAFPHSSAERFREAVYSTSRVTHDTVQGWESALLVATAVSAGIAGQSAEAAIQSALDFVSHTPPRGHWSPHPSVVTRTQLAIDAGIEKTETTDYIRTVVGTSVDSAESIPAAFLVVYVFADDPFSGLCAAANLGGDTDTIAAIAGAILGASQSPDYSDPTLEECIDKVFRVSSLEIDSLIQPLLLMRN